MATSGAVGTYCTGSGPIWINVLEFWPICILLIVVLQKLLSDPQLPTMPRFSQEYTFRTPPGLSPNARVVFGIIGDIGQTMYSRINIQVAIYYHQPLSSSYQLNRALQL